VVVERDRREVGIRELVVRNISAVNLELQLVRLVEDTNGAALTSRQILDGVVEVKLLNLRLGADALLNLSHEHVLGTGGEHSALIRVEVGVVRVDIPRVGGRGGAPSDTNLNIVILESHKGESRLPVLTEGEAEGVELRSSRTVVETGRHRLGVRCGREGGGDEGGVGGILGVHHLTTNEELNLGNQGGPVGDGLCIGAGRVVGGQVDVVEEITLALEANSGHTTVTDVTLDDLTFYSLGKIGVTFVCGAEEADFGSTHEVSILSTDSYKLGDTTRHFII